MKATFTIVFFCAVVGVGAWFFRPPWSHESTQSRESAAAAPESKPKSGLRDDSRAQAQPSPGTNRVSDISERSATQPPTPGTMEQRLARLEAAVTQLQNAFDGVSIEKASAERQALFAADEGYLKADEYFEAGKFAIAGEGYLTFLQHHPEHADAREVMKKVRDAFFKAGYKDKAFWVHEEMIKDFPAQRSGDMWELAQLEKDSGLYDRAVNHAAQAAELSSNAEERLWRRLYWAWYVQLRDGAPAGIAALQQVQQEIATSGVTNPKLAENAAKRMQEWQQQIKGP